MKFIQKDEWPAHSPDLNPIENVWSTLQKQVAVKSPRTKRALKNIATRMWNRMPQESIADYVKSNPHRYQEVIALRGAQTNH